MRGVGAELVGGRAAAAPLRRRARDLEPAAARARAGAAASGCRCGRPACYAGEVFRRLAAEAGLALPAAEVVAGGAGRGAGAARERRARADAARHAALFDQPDRRGGRAPRRRRRGARRRTSLAASAAAMTDWARARFGLGARGLRQPLRAERRHAADRGRAGRGAAAGGGRRAAGAAAAAADPRRPAAAGGDRGVEVRGEDRDHGLHQRACRLHDRAAAAGLRDLRGRPGARGRGSGRRSGRSRRGPPPGRRGRGRRSRRCCGAGRWLTADQGCMVVRREARARDAPAPS